MAYGHKFAIIKFEDYGQTFLFYRFYIFAFDGIVT